jgi:predicted kinase
MKVLKPYDLQVRDDTSLFYNEVDYDDEVDYWMAHRDTPIINILVGPTGCGKTSYIKRMGLTGISFPGIPLSESNKLLNDDKKINIFDTDKFRKGKIRTYIKNKESFIFDGENLTVESRRKIMRMFPDYYKKIAIVWELSEEELIERGATQETLEKTRRIYERPTDSEGIDEFVYILS